MADATPTGTPAEGTPPVHTPEAIQEALPHAQARAKAFADQTAKLSAATTNEEKSALKQAYGAELKRLDAEVAKLSDAGKAAHAHLITGDNLAKETAKLSTTGMKAGLEQKHYKSAISYVKTHADALKLHKKEKADAGEDAEKLTAANKKLTDTVAGINIKDAKVKSAYEHLTDEVNLPKALAAVEKDPEFFTKYHGGKVGMALGAAGLVTAALLPGQKAANPDDPASEKKGTSKGVKWGIAIASGGVALGAALYSKHSSLKPIREALESVYKTANVAAKA